MAIALYSLTEKISGYVGVDKRAFFVSNIKKIY